MDTKKSEKIVQEYLQREQKNKRNVQQFSGTWDTKPEKIFPLLCPAREADWIPGWDCQLLYTESGYAEDKCVFRTEKSNSAGDGLWTFTGFKENEYIEFIKINDDLLLHAKITLKDNKDGSTTGTWHITRTALTAKGNKEIEKIKDESNEHNPIEHMINHYLRKGKMISRASLVMKKVHGH